MLPKALGCKFFEKKKQPVPVNICREEALPFAVGRCLRGTFMYLSAGTCVTVR
jgi:ribosome biogenesis protein UTP30